MSNEMIIVTIIGMAVVTYIPRMLPFLVFKDKELPSFVQAVLRNVPYAALGALIFPAVFFIREGEWLFGLVGMITAILIAFTTANVIFVVLGSITVLMIYSMLF